MKRKPTLAALALLALIFCRTTANPRASGSIGLTALNQTYTQDFDTLASSGTSSSLPEGWDFVESGTITGLDIPNGGALWIRWTDFDVTGSDDGLAVDDFSLTPHGIVGGPTDPSGSGAASPPAIFAGNPAVLTVSVTPGTNPASTGLAVTGDLSAIGGARAQAFEDEGSHAMFSFTAIPDPATTAYGVVNLPI